VPWNAAAALRLRSPPSVALDDQSAKAAVSKLLAKIRSVTAMGVVLVVGVQVGVRVGELVEVNVEVDGRVSVAVG